MYAAANPSVPLRAKSFWCLAPAPATVSYQREPENSHLKIWLAKKGVMSAVGHNVVIKVHDWQSNMKIAPDGDCELEVEVDAASLAVESHWKPAKKPENGIEGIRGQKVEIHEVDNWSIGQIHGTMRSKEVLEVAKYPKVTYKGKGKKSAEGFHFEGTMNLHGTDADLALDSVITVEADKSGMPYFVMKGETIFPMTKWGIKPVSALMGALQLKDEICAKWEVHFVAKAR